MRVADIHRTVEPHLGDHRSRYRDPECNELLGEVVGRWPEPHATGEQPVVEVALELLSFAGARVLAFDKAEIPLQGSIPAHDDLDQPIFEGGCE